MGLHVSTVLPKEPQRKDRTKHPLVLKNWLQSLGDLSSPAGDLTWSSDFRWVPKLWLHVGNSPFPPIAHASGIFKLAMLRCASVSFASGCCLYCLHHLPFHCGWGHRKHVSSSLICFWVSDVSTCCAIAYSERILISSAGSLLNLLCLLTASMKFLLLP